MSDRLFPEMLPSAEARGRLMRTLSQRGVGPYESVKDRIDTPRNRAFWAAAFAGQTGLPKPVFETDEENREASEGYHFGRLARPLFPTKRQDEPTRTRSGTTLTQEIV